MLSTPKILSLCALAIFIAIVLWYVKRITTAFLEGFIVGFAVVMIAAGIIYIRKR